MEKIIGAIFVGCIGGGLACLGQSFGLYLVSTHWALVFLIGFLITQVALLGGDIGDFFD
jgi:hypothetical protein